MNFFIILGLCFKSVVSYNEDGSNVFFFFQDKYMNELKRKVGQAIKDLSSKKQYVVFEDIDVEEDKEVFFVEFTSRDTVINIVTVPKISPEQDRSKLLKIPINIFQPQEEFNIVKLFIKDKCRMERTPKVYFTICCSTLDDLSTIEDCEIVEQFKEKIFAKLHETFPQKKCEVEFYNTNLRNHIDNLLGHPLYGRDTPEDDVSLETAGGEWKKENIVIIPKNDKSKIVFFLNSMILYELNEIINQYTDRIIGKDENWKLDNDQFKKFISTLFNDLGKLSLDFIKIQLKNYNSNYKYIINYILNEKDILKEIDGVLGYETLLLIKNIPEDYPKDFRDQIKNCKNIKEIMNIMMQRVDVRMLETPLEAIEDDNLYIYVFLLKFVCLNEILIENIIINKEKKGCLVFDNLDFFNFFVYDLYPYLEKWTKKFALYSHQDTNLLINTEFEDILDVLKKTELSSTSQIQNTIPNYIFGHLYNVVQYTLGCQEIEKRIQEKQIRQEEVRRQYLQLREKEDVMANF